MRLLPRGNSSPLIHVRKTVAFDGTAGNGAVGTVNVFTITGRVIVERLSAYVSVVLASTSSLGTLSLGTTSDTVYFVNTSNYTDVVDKFLTTSGAGSKAGIAQQLGLKPYNGFTAVPSDMAENMILTVATQPYTSGSIIFDAWYLPITDNGALVAA